MKYIKILLLSLMLFSANAFALSSPSQIAAMMDSGNLRGAESALNDVLHAGKNTAKVHYMLAQVYLKEGRLPNARSELARANQMDPEHSYTDNAHYRPIADAIAGRVVNTSGGPTTIINKSSDNSFLKVLAGILLLGLLGWGIVATIMFYRNKKRAAAELSEADTDLRSSAAQLVQDIQKAILSEKTSVNPSVEKMTAINAVNFRALNVYDRAKSLTSTDIRDFNRMSNEVADIRQALNEVLDADYSGVASTVKVTKTRKSTVAVEDLTPAPASGAAFPPASAAPVITQAAPQPQTVIVNNNGGMTMTDVLVADMLLLMPEPEVVTPDSGNNDSWFSPDTDSGNNDSFSSSSSDSGNNDDWSSSSSDDSSSSSSDWSSSDSSSDSGSDDSW